MFPIKRWNKIGLFLFLLFAGRAVPAQNNDEPISVIITAAGSVNAFLVGTAPLKYNKSFAFSFTLDDGLVCDYLVAFPFFQGGEVDDSYIDQWGNDQGGDELYYPGLYYSDGCGHAVPFRGGIAVNAKNIEGADTIFHHGFLTWKQADRLYRAGWDVLNHSYSHATGKNAAVRYEVEKNNELVKKNIGFNMQDFVIPGGHDDYISDGPYTQAAFEAGMETVQCEHFGNCLIRIDSGLDLDQLKLGRLFMRSVRDTVHGRVQNRLQLRSGKVWKRSSGDMEEGAALFDSVDTRLKQGQLCWVNAFTHGVSNQNIWNISLVFPQFISFFNRLASRYGRQGQDNMWMAPVQEVYEYLLNRRSVKYSVKREGNEVIILIERKSLPVKVRYHELTFLLTCDEAIKKVQGIHCHIESFSAKGRKKIININNLK